MKRTGVPSERLLAVGLFEFCFAGSCEYAQEAVVGRVLDLFAVAVESDVVLGLGNESRSGSRRGGGIGSSGSRHGASPAVSLSFQTGLPNVLFESLERWV